MNHLEQRLTDILKAAPQLMRVLKMARELDLPDWLVFSGAVYQPVLNQLTGRPSDYGIKDYDLAYFDAADISYEAEDVVIRRVAAAFEEPLKSMVEVRNQARVHCWYPAKFGADYPPLGRATDGIDRFLAPACMVGIAPTPRGPVVYAPKGFGDIEGMMVRPNRCLNFRRDQYERKAARWKSLWPELQIMPAT